MTFLFRMGILIEFLRLGHPTMKFQTGYEIKDLLDVNDNISIQNVCEQVVQAPHQGFIRIRREVETAAWLKYGNHRPKLNAPVYKNHNTSKSSDEENESDE